jgi:hypothetical protein
MGETNGCCVVEMRQPGAAPGSPAHKTGVLNCYTIGAK